MAEVSTLNDLTPPTDMLKTPDQISNPTIQFTPLDMIRYVPTGIQVTINTPFTKNSRDPIFAVNLNGYIPGWALEDPYWGNLNRNLMPVQIFPTASAFALIKCEQICRPIDHFYSSYRFFQGNVKVGFRVSSNTNQSGNFYITQASGLQRNFYSDTELYTGLRFLSGSFQPSDYAQENFAIWDVSLNRQVSITADSKNPTKVTDLMKLQQELNGPIMAKKTIDMFTSEFVKYNVLSSQFVEDWLVIGALSDFPNQNSSKITIDILFDYSDVQFRVPVLPLVPTPPSNLQKQILNYSATFNNKVSVKQLDASFSPNT